MVVFVMFIGPPIEAITEGVLGEETVVESPGQICRIIVGAIPVHKRELLYVRKGLIVHIQFKHKV